MITIASFRRWRTELIGWGWRGGLCAAPSAGWAVVAGYGSGREILAMLIGVVIFIVGFAVLSTEVTARRPAWTGWLRAMNLAVWIKAVAPVALASIGVLLSAGDFGKMFPFAAGVPDLVLGIGAVSLTEWASGVRMETLATMDSFQWTLLTTLLQGALISGLLCALACGVKFVLWVRAWWIAQSVSASSAVG